MATILTSGCFDVLHIGHERFFWYAKILGAQHNSMHPAKIWDHNKLIVCVNSDASCKRLKADKHGPKYPIDHEIERMANVSKYADVVIGFDTEEQLHAIVEHYMPCIIVKGPDYAGKSVTGDDIAPLLILDTPEPESVKEMKRRVYSNDSEAK